MPTPPPRRKPAGPPAGSKEALLHALQGAVQSEAGKRAGSGATKAATSSRRVMWLSLVALALVGAWALATRPAWLLPEPAAARNPEFQDASLRMLLFMEARRIENYRSTNGVLPPSLADVGVVPKGVTYSANSDGSWVLTGREGPLELTLRSTDSVAPFLKNSFELLSRREVRP